MKRYRIVSFDMRVRCLDSIPDNWEESVEEMHFQNRENVLRALANQYGPQQTEAKIQNFRELGSAPFSIANFHNRFLAQARNAATNQRPKNAS